MAMGEPSDEMAEAIYKDMPKDVKRIIGIGGGTVMDLCKLFVLKQVSPVLDLFDGKIPVEKEKGAHPHPDDMRDGQRSHQCIGHGPGQPQYEEGPCRQRLYADKAVLISQLLKTLPFKVFATSSIDAWFTLSNRPCLRIPAPASASSVITPSNSSSKVLADPRPRSGSPYSAHERFSPGQQLGRHRFSSRVALRFTP